MINPEIAMRLPGVKSPEVTAANALPRPRPLVKLEGCWPWLERRGLQSTAKCNSAAPEACAVGRPVRLTISMARPGHEQCCIVSRDIPSRTVAEFTEVDLNAQGITTARGQAKWSAVQVARVLERL